MVATQATETIRIPLDEIEVSPAQPRKDFDAAELERLAQSMSKYELLQPIGVRPNPDGATRWQILYGERRLRAARLLKWETIEARVHELDDQDAITATGIENLNRQDWNAIEKAEYLEMLGEAGMTNKEIGEAFGRSKAWSCNLRGLLKLPEFWKDRVLSGEVSASKAAMLLPFLEAPHVMAAITDDYQAQPDLYASSIKFEVRCEFIAQRFEELEDEEPEAPPRRPRLAAETSPEPETSAPPAAPPNPSASSFDRFRPIVEPFRADRDALLLLRRLVDVLLAELDSKEQRA